MLQVLFIKGLCILINSSKYQTYGLSTKREFLAILEIIKKNTFKDNRNWYQALSKDFEKYFKIKKRPINTMTNHDLQQWIDLFEIDKKATYLK